MWMAEAIQRRACSPTEWQINSSATSSTTRPSLPLNQVECGKYCPAFQQIIDAAGVERVPLPPRSPNLNAYAERWIRSVKDEALSRLILFGEATLRHALHEYMEHYHHERPHQGKGNVVLFPTLRQDTARQGLMQCRERLGGLLKYYEREAA